MPGIAASVANAITNAEVRAAAYTGPVTLYLSLHTADPGATGASEVTGGSYARQVVTFDPASGGTSTNSAVVVYSGMPAVTVTHIAMWSTASGSSGFQQSGSLVSSVTLSSGNNLQFNTGQLSYNTTAI